MIQRHMFRVLIASGNHDDAEIIIRGVIASSRQEGGEESKVHAGDLSKLLIVFILSVYSWGGFLFSSIIELLFWPNGNNLNIASLGIVLKSKGEYEAARECFASAIEICKNILAKEISSKASNELTDMLYGIYMEFEDTLLYQSKFIFCGILEIAY